MEILRSQSDLPQSISNVMIFPICERNENICHRLSDDNDDERFLQRSISLCWVICQSYSISFLFLLTLKKLINFNNDRDKWSMDRWIEKTFSIARGRDSFPEQECNDEREKFLFNWTSVHDRLDGGCLSTCNSIINTRIVRSLNLNASVLSFSWFQKDYTINIDMH